MLARLINTPARLRWALNFYPPYIGAGVSVRRISPDWREADVRLALRWYNRNCVGTAFGGSLFAMTDPFFTLLLVQILGRDYVVWDAAASIRFVAPGKGHVHARFRIDDQMLERIRDATAGGDKHFQDAVVPVVDERGELVAEVTKSIYVRKKSRAVGV